MNKIHQMVTGAFYLIAFASVLLVTPVSATIRLPLDLRQLFEKSELVGEVVGLEMRDVMNKGESVSTQSKLFLISRIKGHWPKGSLNATGQSTSILSGVRVQERDHGIAFLSKVKGNWVLDFFLPFDDSIVTAETFRTWQVTCGGKETCLSRTLSELSRYMESGNK